MIKNLEKAISKFIDEKYMDIVNVDIDYKYAYSLTGRLIAVFNVTVTTKHCEEKEMIEIYRVNKEESENSNVKCDGEFFNCCMDTPF